MLNHPDPQDLPELIQQYIKSLARRIRNRHMRRDVLAELRDHFTDALAHAPGDCDRDELAASLIADFGDTKSLSKLIKRAKKRCRPLWVKFVIRTCQSVLVLLIIFVAYTTWFLTGEPTISVDYLTKLNEMVRPVADESLNASPHYLKAIDLYVEPEEDYDLRKLLGSTLDRQERQVLKKWIQSNQAAIGEVRVGTTKPHCWFKYEVAQQDGRPGSLLYLLLPSLQGHRDMGLLLAWQMRFAAEKGDWDSVIADLKSAKTLARHFMQCPTLIEQLVGIAIDQRANKQLMHVLRSHRLPASVLERLAVTLDESFQSAYPIADIGFEYFTYEDLAQRVFTDDGSGDGHLIPSQLPALADIIEGEERPHSYTDTIKFVAGSMIHSSRRDTVALFEQWRRKADEYRSVTPYRNHISGESIGDWFTKTVEENPRNFLFQILVPSVWRAVCLSYMGQANHQAAQTVVALLRYKAEHGQFPQTLDQLVPQYLETVPLDPFGPGPLTYKRHEDDFILYSWGLNFEDHGGQHNKEVFRVRKADGDYVFWPPEPVERTR